MVGEVIKGVAVINGVAVLLFGEGGYLWRILCGRVTLTCSGCQVRCQVSAFAKLAAVPAPWPW